MTDKLVTTAEVVHDMLMGHTTAAKALEEGTLTIEGDETKVHEFFEFFESKEQPPPKLIVR